jgi:hypothetical protein
MACVKGIPAGYCGDECPSFAERTALPRALGSFRSDELLFNCICDDGQLSSQLASVNGLGNLT